MNKYVRKPAVLAIEYVYRFFRQRGHVWLLVGMWLVAFMGFVGFVMWEHGYMTDTAAREYGRAVEVLFYGFLVVVVIPPALEMVFRRVSFTRRLSDTVNEKWESFGEQLP